MLIPEESTREYGNSRTPESPDEDLDDAWRQHDEEKTAGKPVAETADVGQDWIDDFKTPESPDEDLDDSRQQYDEEEPWEPPEEAEPTPEPEARQTHLKFFRFVEPKASGGGGRREAN